MQISKVNAKDYGVPQYRRRCLIMGRRSLLPIRLPISGCACRGAMGACECVEMCDEIRDVRGGGCGRRRGSGGDSVFRGGGGGNCGCREGGGRGFGSARGFAGSILVAIRFVKYAGHIIVRALVRSRMRDHFHIGRDATHGNPTSLCASSNYHGNLVLIDKVGSLRLQPHYAYTCR